MRHVLIPLLWSMICNSPIWAAGLTVEALPDDVAMVRVLVFGEWVQLPDGDTAAYFDSSALELDGGSVLHLEVNREAVYQLVGFDQSIDGGGGRPFVQVAADGTVRQWSTASATWVVTGSAGAVPPPMGSGLREHVGVAIASWAFTVLGFGFMYTVFRLGRRGMETI